MCRGPTTRRSGWRGCWPTRGRLWRDARGAGGAQAPFAGRYVAMDAEAMGRAAVRRRVRQDPRVVYVLYVGLDRCAGSACRTGR